MIEGIVHARSSDPYGTYKAMGGSAMPARRNQKLNCWEFIKCGREPGGIHVAQLGVCPAAITVEADCIHGGKNAGRMCWAVAGTMCDGQIAGTFASKMGNCLTCDFYGAVLREEGEQFVSIARILSQIASE